MHKATRGEKGGKGAVNKQKTKTKFSFAGGEEAQNFKNFVFVFVLGCKRLCFAPLNRISLEIQVFVSPLEIQIGEEARRL
jgi:hypothetical protein